jgi:muconate cycloisomerase
LQWGTELFGPLLLTEDIVTSPLTYADFEMQVPTGAGLGITLDEDKVAHFRRDRTTSTHAFQEV